MFQDDKRCTYMQRLIKIGCPISRMHNINNFCALLRHTIYMPVEMCSLANRLYKKSGRVYENITLKEKLRSKYQEISCSRHNANVWLLNDKQRQPGKKKPKTILLCHLRCNGYKALFSLQKFCFYFEIKSSYTIS